MELTIYRVSARKVKEKTFTSSPLAAACPNPIRKISIILRVRKEFLWGMSLWAADTGFDAAPKKI